MCVGSINTARKKEWLGFPRSLTDMIFLNWKNAQLSNNVSTRPAACGWLWSLKSWALSWASEEIWPSSAPLISSHSDRKPMPALRSSFMSHPICLQKPHFSLFTVSLPDRWSSILCKWRAEGVKSFWKRFEVLNSLLLKYWPAVRVVSETLSGLSQRDIKKAALYSHTSRRNNNEPLGLREL